MENNIKVLDLFCGAGGFSEGFTNHNFEILAGVDIDEDSISTFKSNHNTEAHREDLSKIKADELLDTIDIDPKNIDAIIGGPPCQGFSQAGDRDPDDDRNDLVKNYFDIIDSIDPNFFVMENVRAITYERNSHIIEYIIDRINECGYNYKYDVLNAANFGIPQTRKRIFVIGMKNYDPCLPNPTHSKNQWVGVDDVIDVPEGQIVSSYGTQETLRGNRNTRDISQPSYTLRATRCLIDIISNDYEPPENKENIPSITDARIYRFDESDAARIQSFPDNYDFTGNLTSQRRQIGNAVPPELSSAIAKKIQNIISDK